MLVLSHEPKLSSPLSETISFRPERAGRRSPSSSHECVSVTPLHRSTEGVVEVWTQLVRHVAEQLAGRMAHHGGSVLVTVAHLPKRYRPCGTPPKQAQGRLRFTRRSTTMYVV